jgi:chitinase
LWRKLSLSVSLKTEMISGVIMTSVDPFRVVAYVTEHADLNNTSFERLTHVNYAFLCPNGNGTFQPLDDPARLEKFVDVAHRSGVRALISVGGWGWEAQFAKTAAQPAYRAIFIRDLLEIVRQYRLDGVDMDWEYPRPGSSSDDFLALMSELRRELPREKLLSAAVIAYGEVGAGVPSESFEVMDFVNLMAYDDFANPMSHSSLECARAALDYWLGRGLARQKAVLGVPFYSRPDGVPYARLVEADPLAAENDLSDYQGKTVNYNGIPTIQAKTRLALERGSGIMFWALEQDSSGGASLITAIERVVNAASL